MRPLSRSLCLLAAVLALLPVSPAAAAAPRGPDVARKLQLDRPLPPEHLTDPDREKEAFVPAQDVAKWLHQVFIADSGPLHNPDHSHLLEARIGVLWTSARNSKNMVEIAGTAEVPNLKGERWNKAKERVQMMEWFGFIPDFLLTFDAVFAAEMADLNWCCTSEHELYHCFQKLDSYGDPRLDLDGNPVWAIRGHDVETFVGLGERYGPVERNVDRLVRAVQRPPLIGRADIQLACGTCGSRFA